MAVMATPKNKKGNKSPKSVKKSPSTASDKTPGKNLAKTSGKTPGKNPAKTLDKTPKSMVKNAKRKLSNEESEATSPVAKVQAMASDSDKPTLPSSVTRKRRRNIKRLLKLKMESGVVDPNKFSLIFTSQTVSLFNPAIKELLEVLSKADDVSVERFFIVSCKKTEEKERLQSLLEKHEQSETYSILPVYEKVVKPAFFIYAVGLPPDTKRKDLMSACKNAESAMIKKNKKMGENCSVGRITFGTEEERQKVAEHKMIKIFEKEVPVATSWDDVMLIIKRIQAGAEVNSNEEKTSKMALKEKEHKKVVTEKAKVMEEDTEGDEDEEEEDMKDDEEEEDMKDDEEEEDMKDDEEDDMKDDEEDDMKDDKEEDMKDVKEEDMEDNKEDLKSDA